MDNQGIANLPVIFRRIHGRITPIKVKKQDVKKAASGAAYLAAGAAVGVGTGKAYKKAISFSSATARRGMDALERIGKVPGQTQMNLFGQGLNAARRAKIEKLAHSKLKFAARIDKYISPALRIGGLAASSALLGIGAVKIAEVIKGRKLKSDEAAAVGGGTAAASSAVFTTGMFGMSALRQHLKPVYVKAYPHIRQLKSLLKI